MDSQGTYISVTRIAGYGSGINANSTGDKIIFGPFYVATSAMLQSFAVLITQIGAPGGSDSCGIVLKKNGTTITNEMVVSANAEKSVHRFDIAKFLTNPQHRKINKGDIITITVSTASTANFTFLPVLDIG